MTEQQALTAAINTHLDDDTPRLVYADWLEEHGEAERAELIRVQCELASLKGDGYCPRCRIELSPLRKDFMPLLSGCAKCGHQGPFWSDVQAELHRWGYLRNREQELIVSPPIVAMRQLPFGIVSRRDCIRGFPVALTCSWSDWLRHEAALYWRPMVCNRCYGGGRVGVVWGEYGETKPRHECPACSGSGTVMPTMECGKCHGDEKTCSEKRHKWICSVCNDTGRVPRPCPETAVPLERVTLTTWPDLPVDGLDAEDWAFMGRGTAAAILARECERKWPGITFTLPSSDESIFAAMRRLAGRTRP